MREIKAENRHSGNIVFGAGLRKRDEPENSERSIFFSFARVLWIH
jgi:hypothetical protein